MLNLNLISKITIWCFDSNCCPNYLYKYCTRLIHSFVHNSLLCVRLTPLHTTPSPIQQHPLLSNKSVVCGATIQPSFRCNNNLTHNSLTSSIHISLPHEAYCTWKRPSSVPTIAMPLMKKSLHTSLTHQCLPATAPSGSVSSESSVGFHVPPTVI